MNNYKAQNRETRIFSYVNDFTDNSSSSIRSLCYQSEKFLMRQISFRFNDTDYGILINCNNYVTLAENFKKYIKNGKNIKEIYESLKNKECQIAIWSINSKTEVVTDPSFTIFVGQCSKTKIVRLKKQNGGHLILPLAEISMVIISCHDETTASINDYFLSQTILKQTPELSFELTQYLRKKSMKQYAGVNFTATGIIIDSINFRNIHKYKIEKLSEIMHSINDIASRIGSASEQFNIKLILSELLTNAFSHGRLDGHPAKLRIYDSDDHFFFEANDLRDGIEKIESDDKIDLLDESGRGLFLIKAYCEKLFIDANSTTAMLKKQ